MRSFCSGLVSRSLRRQHDGHLPFMTLARWMERNNAFARELIEEVALQGCTSNAVERTAWASTALQTCIRAGDQWVSRRRYAANAAAHGV